MRKYKIIIIGSGPSGSATALELAHVDPNLSSEVLMLDKAVFPRPKLCAGGVTLSAELILNQLGVKVELPALPVNVSRFVLPFGLLTVEQADQFRIFDRAEFDHLLFRTACSRGIVTQQGEPVQDIVRESSKVIVRTLRNEYEADIVIGADGAKGIVRKALGLGRTDRLLMAMEIFVPSEKISRSELTNNMAVFDFTRIRDSRGYCWIFPAAISMGRKLSLGITDSGLQRDGRVPMKRAFAQWLLEHGLDLKDWNVQAHPAIEYEPRATSSQPRVLLVGDAAGIDPLFGEGITSALALGRLAAHCALEALQRNDFSFSDYDQKIRNSVIGIMMRRRRLLARRLFSDLPIRWRNQEVPDLFQWISSIDPREGGGKVFWAPNDLYKTVVMSPTD